MTVWTGQLVSVPIIIGGEYTPANRSLLAVNAIEINPTAPGSERPFEGQIWPRSIRGS